MSSSSSSSTHPLHQLIESSNNIMILAGAGISVSTGIPDFRSKNGLYNTLDYKELGLTCAEDLFDYEFFVSDPKPFYKFARNLFPGTKQPTLTHIFFEKLHEEGKLLRIYTQNIDGLEEVAGVDSGKIVYCHGSLTKAKCLTCSKEIKAIDILDVVKDGNVPLCQNEKKGKKRKVDDAITVTSKGGESNKEPPTPPPPPPPPRRTSSRLPSLPISQPPNRNLCNGTIKPNITFFGESLQSTFEKTLTKDAKLVDLLIVIGTSLTVSPVNRIPGFLQKDVKKVLINRNVVISKGLQVKKEDEEEEEEGDSNNGRRKSSGNMFDLSLLGDCDAVLANVYPPSAKEVIKNEGDEKVINDILIKEMDYKSVDEDSSVFLFENGVYNPPTFENYNKVNKEVKKEEKEEEEEKVVVEEIVTCDICTLPSTNPSCQPFYECSTCWDYALCCACHELVMKTSSHFNDEHRFIVMK